MKVVQEKKKRYESSKSASRGNFSVHPNPPFLFGVVTQRGSPRYSASRNSERKSDSLQSRRHKRILCRKITLNVFKDIAKTLEHIHCQEIVKNDLKSNNVSIQRDEGRNYQPTVIDFGKSEEIAKFKAYRRNSDNIALEDREGVKQSPASDFFYGAIFQSCVSSRIFYALLDFRQ